MPLKTEKEEFGEGFRSTKIYLDKFKSNYLAFYIIRPLDREEVTMNALLPMVLNRGTKNYSNKILLERKLEELYGANLSISSSKRGERQVIKFSIEWADEKYTNEESFDNEVFEMFKEVIYDPYLIDGEFSHKYVEGEKNNLANKINNKINDKRSYAINRCIEEMCKSESFSIYKYGYLQDLEAIDAKGLAEHYENILMTSQIEIIYTGNKKELSLDKIIPKKYLNRENINYVEREEILSKPYVKNQIVEKLDVTQGKLVLGFRTKIAYEMDLYPALLLANELLGGGPNSKLFKDVREKHSLAYYVTSNIIKHKSIMILDAGIEFQNYNKISELINENIKELQEGKFSDEDLSIAKRALRTSSESIVDSAKLISEFYFGNFITNESRNLEELLDEIDNVSREEVVEAINTLNLDTIYFMRGTGEEENNESNKE
ncbi:MAG: insulinase family protein [Gudongella sp.]|nr:insulinase family protein [Gudongella sp.]